MSAEELNRQWDNDWVPQKYQKTDILRSGRQPHWTRCGGVRGRCSCPRFRHGPSRGSDCASPARQHHPELKGAHQTNSDDRCLWSGTLDCWAYQPANGFFMSEVLNAITQLISLAYGCHESWWWEEVFLEQTFWSYPRWKTAAWSCSDMRPDLFKFPQLSYYMYSCAIY